MEDFVKSAEEVVGVRMVEDRSSLPPPPQPAPTTDVQQPHSSRSSTTQVDAEQDTKMFSPPPLEKPDGDESLEVLASGMREMVDLVNKLRMSGIEDLGLPLPRIAVVGNQSAGKSSLIEAISEIKVPRYTGTCTRCPLEINLREASHGDGKWSCRISLRFKKQHLKDGGNPPWVDIATGTQQHHFMDVFNKNDVEFALVRAQCAILNPSRDWRTYIPSPGESLRNFARPKGDLDFEVQFSPNVVCMDITGPGLPNLAFIDLPGVIQSTENPEEDYLIDLVQSLVTEYVSEQDCLILLAMTMKDDAVNQKAGSLARQLGADRTIGALTKPDTVEAGEHEQWVSILRGNTHALRHGYFVTKQPNQEALNKGVDNPMARRLEEEFFSTTPPWCTELGDLKHKFGTAALAQYLSDELGKLIRNRLPTIIDAIDRQLDSVSRELEQLPAPPPENHFVTVERLLNGFSEELQIGLHGKNNSAKTMLREKARGFLDTLGSLSPGFVVLDTPGDEARIADELRRGGSGEYMRPREPSQSRPDVDSPNGRKRPRDDHPQESPKRPRNNAGERNGGLIKYNLPQIRHIVESTSGSNIPNQVDPEALDQLCRKSIAIWRAPLERFLRQTHDIVSRVVRTVFQAHFAKYSKSPILEKSHIILHNFHLEVFTKQEEAVSVLLKQEFENIGTLNREDYDAQKQKYLRTLEDRRRRNLEDQKTRRIAQARENAQREAQQTTPTPVARGRGRGSAQQQRAVGTPDHEEPDISESFSREIGILADTKAYHDIARKRFADNVHHSILSGFLKTCREQSLRALRDGLGINGENAEEVCRELLTEDPQQERLRRELIMKKEQLSVAKQEVYKHLQGAHR